MRILVGLAVLATAAPAADRALPPPSFTATGQLGALAASGPIAALATGGDGDCALRLFDLARGTPPARVKEPLPCHTKDTPGGFLVDVWLGKTAIAAKEIYSESPHGDNYTYWSGPRPAGPLRRQGEDWGWVELEQEAGYGCAWSAAAGGGVIAEAQVPNTLAVDMGLEDKPSCPAGPTTKILLKGAATPQVVVKGSWETLATDGKRLVLASLDDKGARTGELSLVDFQGTPSPAPAADGAAVKATYAAWLTPDGLVLQTRKGVYAPGWTVARGRLATVGYGRVLYAIGRTLHVRRIRGGPDRALLTLPRGTMLTAAGSFGVAIATDDLSGKVALYRLPWRVIDRTLTAR